jgi:hypothetical protein
MSEENADAKIQVQEGVIGYFDILGFKNYIKNDPDIGTKNALEVILKIKTDVPQKIKGRFDDDLVLDEVRWSVLSDTIVLSVPYLQMEPDRVKGEETNTKTIRWAALMFSAVALMDYMFEQGLPIRGAISYGKYFANENILAGKSVVEALTLAERLHLSAVAICPEAEKELRSLLDPEGHAKKWARSPVYFSYLVPFKGGMEKLLVLNQWALHDKHANSDIPQLVAQAFWKHGKDMDASVYQKYQNTEMLLRYVVAMKREWKT